MSAFRFVHAADLHLGSPFAGLARASSEVAERFALASREAFSELVRRTIEAEAAFMVIAGDVYDGEWKDSSIGLFFARELAKLDRAGIPVVLLKGNHDAASVVTRTITLPDSVRQFSDKKPETIRLDHVRVALHGQSFAERAASERLALAYPDAAPGWFNIGVLHTCGEGSAAHAPYAPCTVQELSLRGYDYWALGHVHEHAVLCEDPWVVFPGNLQGRSVRECGPKGAVMVEVADGRVTSVERMIVDGARWAHLSVDLDGVDDEAALLGRIMDAAAPVASEAEGRLVAARLTLSGRTRLHDALMRDRARMAMEAQAALQRIESEFWLEKLKLQTSGDDARPGVAPELKSFDLAALVDGLVDDPEVIARADEIVAAITKRLPAGLGDDEASLAGELPALLAEARAVALAKAGA